MMAGVPATIMDREATLCQEGSRETQKLAGLMVYCFAYSWIFLT